MTATAWSAWQEQLHDLVDRYRSSVDFLAVRLEALEGTNIALRSGRTETLSTGVSIGGQVRACHRGGWGFASFNDLNSLAARIQEAIAVAQQVGDDTTQLAPVAPLRTHRSLLASDGSNDPRRLPLTRKKDLCDRYAALLHELSPDITSSTVRYSDSVQHVFLLTSEGTEIEQSWPDWELRVAATARDGDLVQVGRETTGSRRSFADLEGLDDRVRSAGARAIAALHLPAVEGGTYTVVIDPILAGLFVHEAFGHLSEADALYENPDLLETMSLGRRFGNEELNIYDGAAPIDGDDPHRGSYFFDDEGVPATTTQLLEKGVLVGRLHSRETAGKLGEAPTGNARCLDYHYPPLVRMTNTWIAPGSTPRDRLFEGIAYGLYASNWQGGMTNGEMFTFTAGEAWVIRRGKLAEPVRDVTLSGNVFTTLADIEAIGNDFAWDESGGCGKGGQSGLAVGCGAPSLRIRNVVVGGEAD